MNVFFSLVLDAQNDPTDGPVLFDVYLSNDGNFSTPTEVGLQGSALRPSISAALSSSATSTSCFGAAIRKAFAPFGLAEDQEFMEFDLVHLTGGMFFWGARHVDGRGFDTEENRPTHWKTCESDLPAAQSSRHERPRICLHSGDFAAQTIRPDALRSSKAGAACSSSGPKLLCMRAVTP
ncbi:MAG TPA: hypothetical protein VHW01_07725 [Polyangiaceae bacterium]|nr:hypothetical protein [Polyangiaceae bacterium]